MAASFVVGAVVYLVVMSGVELTTGRLLLGFAAMLVVGIVVAALVGGPRGGTMAERLSAFLDRFGR